MHRNELIVAPYSTLIQREIYTEDFNSIIGHLPFLKNRLESDIPSKFIQKIVNTGGKGSLNQWVHCDYIVIF